MASMTTDLPAEATTSWRALLGFLIRDTTQRERVVTEMGINAVTLSRWVRGKNTPHVHSLYPLVHAFPEHRDLFLHLLNKEFPDVAFPATTPSDPLSAQVASSVAEHIPLKVYEHVLTARTTTPRIHLFWTVANHVLRTMLEQLDATQQGIALSISQCLATTMSDGTYNVLGLRERIQFGTAPWKNDTAPLLLLGRESLAGYAVSKAVPVVCQNVHQTHLPIRHDPYVASMAACPLLFGEAIAGCLTIASTQVDYFTPPLLSLLEQYTRLTSLAFLDTEFFPRHCFHLAEMPSTLLQQQHAARVFPGYRDSAMNHLESSVGIEEAEQHAFLRLAQDLARMTKATEQRT